MTDAEQQIIRTLMAVDTTQPEWRTRAARQILQVLSIGEQWGIARPGESVDGGYGSQAAAAHAAADIARAGLYCAKANGQYNPRVYGDPPVTFVRFTSPWQQV